MSERRDEELQRFFDGELSPRRARKVHARIVDEPDQARRLEALDEMGALVREAAEAEAEEADFSQLWARVERGIEADASAERERSFVPSRLLRWGIGLSAAAAAAVLAVVLLNPLQAPPQRNDCMIESLEVGAGATSTIFTIDDPERADATTVVWVSETQGE
jgi:anti-sigma factor RsiW